MALCKTQLGEDSAVEGRGVGGGGVFTSPLLFPPVLLLWAFDAPRVRRRACVYAPDVLCTVPYDVYALNEIVKAESPPLPPSSAMRSVVLVVI